MKRFSKKAATLVGEVLTKLQCDVLSSNDYVRSTAFGGGAL